MLKVRDPILINNVASYIEKQSDDLKLIQTNLKNHITDILKNYQGNDAQVIVSKYIEAANKLNSLIQNIDYYTNYMKTISSFDSDNLNSVKNNLNSINTDITSLQTTKFNIKGIDGDFNG